MRYNYILTAVAAIALSSVAGRAGGDDIDRTTISNLDVERYMGLWYEIARFDHRFERNLEKCKALYTMRPNGKISVENSGVNAVSGQVKVAHGKAKMGKRAGALRVSFFLWFYSDYNILALDKEYQWALIGSHSPRYLWILARTPKLSDEVLNSIIDIARERGYDTSQLIYVRQ